MDSRGPARKQRRFRDPYAIESDDEDMDTITELPREESLADFLRNNDPPNANHANVKPFAANVRGTTVPSSSHGSPRGPAAMSPYIASSPTTAGAPEKSRFSSDSQDDTRLGDSLRYQDEDEDDYDGAAPAPQIEKFGRNRLGRKPSSSKTKGIWKRIGVGS